VTRTQFLLACAAAIVLIAAAYANSLDNTFHFDDGHVSESNLYLRSLANVPRFFTDANTFSSHPQNATYRPLVTLSLALDYARGGLDPRPYHVTQIALLLIVGGIVDGALGDQVSAERHFRRALALKPDHDAHFSSRGGWLSAAAAPRR